MDFRGYITSQRNYFYGLKVHALMSGSGIPVEIVFLTDIYSDISAFHGSIVQIPKGSVILADKAYNDYSLEDSLMEVDVHLMLGSALNQHSA